MSARLLRKVLQEREQLRQSSSLDEEAKSSEELELPASKAVTFRNPFDLLDDQESEHEVDDDDSVEDIGISVSKSLYVPLPNSKPSSNPKSKKKKKKKNKDNITAKEKSEQSLDSIFDDLSITGRNPGRSNSESKPMDNGVTANTRKLDQSHVLAVDPKHLKAENELKKIFGAKVVSSLENNQGTSISRQMHSVRRGINYTKRTILLSPLGHWPRWDSSLSMELLETKDGVHHFRYLYSQSYLHVQEMFEAAKAAHDLNAIASILAHHPYHVEALLTFAEVFKFSGEHQASADAIGKCLYGLECAWHPLFDPTRGNCQIKYNHETNKPLFSALFSHMKNLDRRGCHRSALEVCKLLLSLDFDDPVGALFCIDYFSLRAQQFSWLEKFSEEYRADNSIWLFPNFSYSLAVCRFYLECEAASAETADTDKSSSTDLMKQALMLHPSVVKKLVEKAPLKDPAWTQILKHSFFASARAGSPTLDHLINIYVERSYIIWRLPELQNLLKETALLVIDTVKGSSSEVKDWACVRKEAFSSERNEYSHLLVSDFSDVVPTIPPEDLRQFMVAPHAAHDMPDANRDGNPAGDQTVREVAGRNPAIVFLESLLPWVSYGSSGHGNDQGNED